MNGERPSSPWSPAGGETSAARQRELESQLDEIAAEIGRLRRQRAEAIEEFRAFTAPRGASPDVSIPSATPESAPTRSSAPVAGRVGTLEALAAELADRGSRTMSRLEPFDTREPEPRDDRVPLTLHPRRSRGSLRLIVPILVLVVGAAASPWMLGRLTRTEAPRDVGRPPAVDVQPVHGSTDAGGALSAARAVETPPEPVGTSGVAPAPALTVELTTIREVWLRSRVDDEPASARILAAGQTFILEADQLVEVRLGDAGAATVRLNGEDRGPFGRDGEVLTRRFEPDRRPPLP